MSDQDKILFAVTLVVVIALGILAYAGQGV